MEVRVLGTRRLGTPFCQDLLREETLLNWCSKVVKFQDAVGHMELSGKL